jgi:tetratricopeptide (TPR) repeat protein
VEELSKKALELEKCGELQAALDCFCRCIAMCQLNGSREAMLVKADILYKTGVVYWKTGHYDDALEILIESLRLYENCIEVDRARTKFVSNTVAYNKEAEILSAVLNSLGQVCLSRSELVASMKCYQKSLEFLKEAYQTDGTNDGPTIQKSSCKSSNPSMARTIICIGMVHEARGNEVLALRRYKEGLKAQYDCLGDEHVDIAATLNSMGSVYEQQGQYQLAMDSHKKALGIYRSQLGKNHVDVAVTLNFSGQIYHHFNEFDQGLKAYEEALEIFRYVLGPSHRNIAACMMNVALLHAARNDHQLAIKILKEVLKMQKHCLSDNHADIGVTLESIAISYEAMHKVNKAHKFLVRSLRVRRAALGRQHPFVAITLFRIGVFHLETTGELDEALKRFETCRDVYRFNPKIKEDDARLLQIEENIQSIHMRSLSNNRSFDSFDKKTPKPGHNRQRSDVICDFAEALK